MRHATVLALASLLLIGFAGSQTSLVHAKRAQVPEAKLCNKGKSDVRVARMGYAGRGRTNISGWLTIEPGKCKVVRTRDIHVEGRPVKSTKFTGKGCVVNGKNFSFNGRRSELTKKSFCDGKEGTLVPFMRIYGGDVDL